MSSHTSPPPVSSKTELEIVVNWRMIGWGAALAVLLVALSVVGFLCIRSPKSEPDAPIQVVEATRTSPAPRTDSPRVRFDPASVAALNPPPQSARTAEAAPAKRMITEPRPVTKPVVVKTPERTESVAVEVADKTPPQSAPRAFKRSSSLYEYEMLRQLAEVPTFDLDSSLKTSILGARPNVGVGKDAKGVVPQPDVPKHALLALADKKADLQGLPLIGAKDCQKKKESALAMQALSGYIRRFDSSRRPRINQSPTDDIRSDQELLLTLEKTDLFSQAIAADRQAKAIAKDGKDSVKMKGEDLAVLVQMLQIKGPAIRMQLVKMLDECKDAEASVLLARRALFDTEGSVREAAVGALRNRPRAEFRRVLLDGFRHPWPPVAAHAAEALAELGDIDAAPQLTALLDQPDPCAPSADAKGQWVVRELIGINHLRNCVLCHAPSHDNADPGRSPVPKQGERLPAGGYSEKSFKGDGVRADITYLRQDFSAMQSVEKPESWPNVQRFDYIVRIRQLTPAEVTRHLNDKPAAGLSNYAQRSSVLFALRELTGEDAGEDSAQWRRLLRRMGLDRTQSGGRMREG
jgi:hypothetical protein